jgi:hypothetical protein
VGLHWQAQRRFYLQIQHAMFGIYSAGRLGHDAGADSLVRRGRCPDGCRLVLELR